MDDHDEMRRAAARAPGFAGLALAQGVILCLLSSAAAGFPTWPATRPALFQPLALVALFIPPLAMLAWPRLPRRAALAWLGAAALVAAAVGVHSATRGGLPPEPGDAWPGAAVWFPLGAALFVAQALAVPALRARRLRPAYAEVFETASRTLLQLALTAAFVGAFWMVLFAGAELLKLVHIDFLSQLLERRWFSYPASTLAFAAALLLLDARPGLIAGVRTVLLALFSWLLPVAVAIVAVFLLGLPFVSLAELWRSRMSAGLLLGMALALAAFLNCAYQGGEAPPRGVRRLAARVAALEILPLVALAAWGLGLRVGQYGWSVERIQGGATILVAAVAGAGYALAALPRGPWLKRVEGANLAAAAAFVAAMLALLTPAADPARLMVADQMARLGSGAARPESFDYVTLRFEGARWGRAALARLAADPAAAEAARTGAEAALARESRYGAAPKPSGPAEFLRLVDVLPEGRTPPDALIEAILGAQAGDIGCPQGGGDRRCALMFVRVAPDSPEAAVFYDRFRARVYAPAPEGGWRSLGRLEGDLHCPEVRAALAAGAFAPEPPALPNLRLEGRVLALVPGGEPGACR